MNAMGARSYIWTLYDIINNVFESEGMYHTSSCINSHRQRLPIIDVTGQLLLFVRSQAILLKTEESSALFKR